QWSVPNTLPHPSLVSVEHLGTTTMSSHLSSQVHANASPESSKAPCVRISIPLQPQEPEPTRGADGSVDYMARTQWLRAAVLGANDGLVSIASLMVGVGAVNQSAKAMLVSGLAGLVGGACSMAIGEFVSVYAQYDIEVAEMEKRRRGSRSEEGFQAEKSLPSPLLAAGASALAFSLGAVLPLLVGGVIRSWSVRVGAVCVVSSLGLAGFGAAGAVLGGADIWKPALRVLGGGWLAMLVTYGVLRIFRFLFNMQVSSA
ncbi:hypothetical protein B296_00053396, partial [Ensete ventricosum]